MHRSRSCRKLYKWVHDAIYSLDLVLDHELLHLFPAWHGGHCPLPCDADECSTVGEHHALPIVFAFILLLTPIEFRVLDYEARCEAVTSSNGVDDLVLVDDTFIHGSDNIHRHILIGGDHG